MKLNTNGNVYTIVYASVMVVIVALLLAVVSAGLKARQDANVLLDTQKQILASLNLREFASDAEAQATYNEQITEVKCEKCGLSWYEANLNGEKKFILPVRGAGLWGPIWGYIALNEDKQTIFGVFFNHEGETPGLGGEIKNYEVFQKQFENKALLHDGQVMTIEKAGNGGDVDCISGATITSKGVETMLHSCVAAYIQAGWFATNEVAEENVTEVTDSIAANVEPVNE